jgi:hypothetical protein
MVKAVYRKTGYLVATLAILAGMLLPHQGGATAQAQAGTGSTLLFLPVVVDEIQWFSNGPTFSLVGVSKDWVAYTVQNGGCGHCGPYAATIRARNVADGRKVSIKAAVLEATPGSASFQGATEIQVAAPTLIWHQPVQPPPGGNTGPFSPGTFTCEVCYYDLDTGQGGAWNGTFTPDPPSDYEASAEYIPPPVSDGTYALKVTRKSTGEVVVRTTLGKGGQLLEAKTGTDKVAYNFAPHSLPGPSQIKVAWLVQPDPAFQRTWQKADGPVAAHSANRSWLWGPSPIFTGKEAYAEGANGTHLVQYFDKSRMEINNPSGNANDPFYVTNGLLTVELISQEIQTGNDTRIQASVPCTIPVAGDPRKDNPLTPGYAALAAVSSLHGENQAANRTGQSVDGSMDVDGNVGKDTAHANLARYTTFVKETGHNVPDVFWRYLTGMKATYGFDWTFVLGYPITEGYWTRMRVGGKDMPVLIQAYQRRVLTYVPDFPSTWQVQQGNVGQHYLEWRYELNGIAP